MTRQEQVRDLARELNSYLITNQGVIHHWRFGTEKEIVSFLLSKLEERTRRCVEIANKVVNAGLDLHAGESVSGFIVADAIMREFGLVEEDPSLGRWGGDEIPIRQQLEQLHLKYFGWIPAQGQDHPASLFLEDVVKLSG